MHFDPSENITSDNATTEQMIKEQIFVVIGYKNWLIYGQTTVTLRRHLCIHVTFYAWTEPFWLRTGVAGAVNCNMSCL